MPLTLETRRHCTTYSYVPYEGTLRTFTQASAVTEEAA